MTTHACQQQGDGEAESTCLAQVVQMGASSRSLEGDSTGGSRLACASSAAARACSVAQIAVLNVSHSSAGSASAPTGSQHIQLSNQDYRCSISLSNMLRSLEPEPYIHAHVKTSLMQGTVVSGC